VYWNKLYKFNGSHLQEIFKHVSTLVTFCAIWDHRSLHSVVTEMKQLQTNMQQNASVGRGILRTLWAWGWELQCQPWCTRSEVLRADVPSSQKISTFLTLKWCVLEYSVSAKFNLLVTTESCNIFEYSIIFNNFVLILVDSAGLELKPRSAPMVNMPLSVG